MRTLPSDHYRSSPRIEVMPLADNEPDPLWLCAAPGSGVWWDPGRRLVAPNLISAILKYRPMEVVVEHLRYSASRRAANSRKS